MSHRLMTQQRGSVADSRVRVRDRAVAHAVQACIERMRGADNPSQPEATTIYVRIAFVGDDGYQVAASPEIEDLS